MKIDIYTSAKNGNKYLSVQAGVKLETLEIGDTLDSDMLLLSPFRTRLEVDASKPHKALNAKDIVQQIETNGFALHSAKTKIKFTTKKKVKSISKSDKLKTTKQVPVKIKKTSKTAVTKVSKLKKPI